MTDPRLTFHTFDPENYEKHVYEALTFASQKIPVYPNNGKLTNLLDGTELPLDKVYKVRILDSDKYSHLGIDSTYIE